MLYRCLFPPPQAGCHFRIDSLSCVEVGTWPTWKEGVELKIHLLPRSKKYYSFKGFIVTRATHGENDCSYGPARCSAESIYQMAHYVPTLNTECQVGNGCEEVVLNVFGCGKPRNTQWILIHKYNTIIWNGINGNTRKLIQCGHTSTTKGWFLAASKLPKSLQWV